MKKIFVFCERYSVQILIFLICIPALIQIRDINRDVNSFHTIFYVIDYSTGFGGKKLLGELCSLWLPKEVGRQHLLPLIIAINILMVSLFAWFCGKCLSRDIQTRRALLVFLAIYMLSPFSFTFLINLYFHADFYLATATLCYIYLFIRHRGKWYYYLLTCIILCIACLIHHIFCNIYFPLIFALFIYDVFSGTKHITIKIVCYLAISLIVSLLFLSIVLFSDMNIAFESLYSYLQERATDSTSALSLKIPLYYEFYAKLPEHYIAYVQPVWKYNIARFVLTIIFLSPLLILFWTPWILAIRYSDNKRERLCYILMQMSMHLIILPAYIMAVDYDRWNCAYCFSQFCLTLLLYYFKTKNFAAQVDRVIHMLERHFVVVLLIIIYISSLELHNSTLLIVDKICNKMNLVYVVNEITP